MVIDIGFLETFCTPVMEMRCERYQIFGGGQIFGAQNSSEHHQFDELVLKKH